MSRIHEALKRAEEERMANQGAAAVPSQVMETVEPMPVIVDEPSPMAMASSVTAQASSAPGVMDSNENPYSYSNLVARCAKPEWKPDPQRILFMTRKGHHEVGMEEFRTLRSRLYRIREKRQLKVILIASAMPAEGKSFISANLTQVLARQHGPRALLIDADLRKPRLHEYFGAPSAPGLTDYLKGETDEFSIIQRSPAENMFFIPGGTQVANPAELVSNNRMKMLLQRMAPIFDWIVVDSPPAVPVSDAGLMAQHSDGVLLVVHAGKTPMEMAQRARQEFKDRPLLGVVLNRVPAQASYSGYYYYGKYGYYGAKPAGKSSAEE